jgi:hypothetical protein
VSLSPPEDRDPLLEFSSEPGKVDADQTPPPEVQPVTAPVVAEPPQPDATAQPPVDARVEQLERALKESRSHALALKSEVATLVRAVADIRKQVDRPVVPVSRSAGPKTKLAAAVAGLFLGVTLGVFGWQYLSGEAEMTLAPTTPVSAQALVPEPQPAASRAPDAEAPAPITERALTPKATSAPKSPKASPPPAPRPAQVPRTAVASKAPRYVGTLSIDADPGGEVFVNRQSVGTTPLRLTDLRAGSHLIWIEREGYRRWTRVVPVPADRVTRISAELEPIGAR